jgi:outer membrane protein TolC
MHSLVQHLRRPLCAWIVFALLPAGGCASFWREEADEVAYSIVEATQINAFGQAEPFTITPAANTLRRRLLLDQDLPRPGPASIGADALPQIAHWPEPDQPATREQAPAVLLPDDGPLVLNLNDALQVAARNNRTYQTRKEAIFQAALDLDLESQQFRSTFLGTLETLWSNDLTNPQQEVRGLNHTGTLGWKTKLRTGAELTANLAVNIVQLLHPNEYNAMGIIADATVTVPLLRGAGEYVVTEPLTQAQREVLYALLRFRRYRKELIVEVTRGYLGVLQQADVVENNARNYESLIKQTRRARRLAEAARLPEIQVGQARQNELSARNRWISAQQRYASRLDDFKITLGLPTDAQIALDESELTRLAETVSQNMSGLDDLLRANTEDAKSVNAPVELNPPTASDGGPWELPELLAIGVAMKHRLDLQVAKGEVFDAQRKVTVAANALEAGLTLEGSAQIGESRSLRATEQDNVKFNPEHGLYTAGLLLDLPLERTAERNAYRNSYITLAQSVRTFQELEDTIKLQVRDDLRALVESRESFRIQAQAVQLAQRRVKSTELFLQAGRAEIRDVLEAQESLVTAQNQRTAALVNYRITELQLQRDMGILSAQPDGLWTEVFPDE